VRATEELRFPCEECPADTGRRRLLGIYEQRQQGLHMQRVKVHGGQLTAPQLRTLAELALAHTPGYPLHVTTRQDVEFHGVRPQDLPALQEAIAEAGLTTMGACGDALRNVVACPGNCLARGTVEVSSVADAIRGAAESLPFIRQMPRKFKISVSGCEKACARPWINCLGFVAREDGTFNVIGAGSLGHRPATGIELYEALDASQLVPLTVAALRMFDAEGDRERRFSARFRHVRERMGDEEFRRQLDVHFQQELQRASWPVPDAPKVLEGKVQVARLCLPYGDLSVEEAAALAAMAKSARATIRLGFEHDVFVYSRTPVRLSPVLRRLAGNSIVVACPGTTWCMRGISDSRAAEQAIRRLLPRGCELTIGISGCPNNCTHAAVADIGLTGRIRSVDGVRTHCFALLAGGGGGLSPELAVELHPAVPSALAPAVVACLVNRHRKLAGAEVRFGDFIRGRAEQLSETIAAHIKRDGSNG